MRALALTNSPSYPTHPFSPLRMREHSSFPARGVREVQAFKLSRRTDTKAVQAICLSSIWVPRESNCAERHRLRAIFANRHEQGRRRGLFLYFPSAAIDVRRAFSSLMTPSLRRPAGLRNLSASTVLKREVMKPVERRSYSKAPFGRKLKEKKVDSEYE